MRILFLTQYYPPEPGACQNRISYLARALGRSGHTVTVLTAMPNYPAGRIFEPYRGRLFFSQELDGVHVLRTWLYAPGSSGFARRLLCYWSFVLLAFVAGLLHAGPQDVIITESPPLFLGTTGLLLNWLKGAKHVFNVSDLWPESAVAMAVVTNRVLITAAVRLEEFIYHRSDLITAQTRGILDDIQPRSNGVPVALLTNGIDVEEFECAPAADRDRVRAQLGIGQEFVLGYFGLHGLGQGLDTALRAASLLRDHPDILFVFFGDGPVKQNLIRESERLGLQNVRFFAPQPADKIRDITRAVDASLVPLKNLPLFRGALPSKLFTSMGAGIPVIAALDGEARELLCRAQAGICVEPENPRELADAVLRLAPDPELCRTLGQNGFCFVREHYDRQRIAAEFEQDLLNLFGPAVVSETEHLPKPQLETR